MNTEFSPTIPLSFTENESYDEKQSNDYNRESLMISPTKSLNYNDNSPYRTIKNNNIQPNENVTSESTAKILPKSSVTNSASNSTIESFVTAVSEVSFDRTSSNNASQRHIFATLAGNNSSVLTLPQRETEAANTSLETPKAPLRIRSMYKYESVYDRVNIGGASSSKDLLLEGLGLPDITSSSSTGSLVNMPLVKEPTSPVKAIRTSRLINEFNFDTSSIIKNTENESRTLPDDEGFKLQQEDSNIADHTINTIAFDNINLSVNPSPDKHRSSLQLPEETPSKTEVNYGYLFIAAIHSFNAQSLEDNEDIKICLSFEKNDIAFVHIADESGWGEVTMLKEQKRGWVPLNYFTDVLQPELVVENHEDNLNDMKKYVTSKIPLQPLLIASAKFLVDCDKSSNYNRNIKIELVNGIRDGVKKLLLVTECVSRSNDLVKNYINVKKTRKKLLADWYNLMIKADYYKNTHSARNITTITILIFQMLLRAFSFYDTWSTAKLNQFKLNEEVVDEGYNALNYSNKKSPTEITTHKILQSNNYLDSPPFALERLTEIYDVLFSYISIILGRLDMIEHNPAVCESLELIVHQIIILLRELLYISKSCSYIIQEKYRYAYERTLDSNLDPLLSLVSELVSCIKILITQTLQGENQTRDTPIMPKNGNSGAYRYTPEGQHLIKIVSQMTTLIKNVVFGCNSYIKLIGDFKMSDDREYHDLSSIRLTPEKFINMFKNKTAEGQHIPQKEGKYSKIARFSCIDPNGSNIADKNMLLINPIDTEEKTFSRDSIFEQYKIEDSTVSEETENPLSPINYKEIIQKEILFDKEGSLIGASFRAFIFKLTDELDKPDDLLMASFLLNFRTFGNVVDLVNELISRFDISDKSSQYDIGRKNGAYSSRASRLKSRRRLVCVIFQKWMESFWDVRDYNILPTMVNFFNEGVSLYLPIESKNLIEVASRLFFIMTNTSTDSMKSNLNRLEIFPQLRCCTMLCSKVLSVISEASSIGTLRSSVFSLDDRIIEQYGLTKTRSNSTMNGSPLPLPLLNIGRTPLLNDDDIEKVKKSINFYANLTELSIDFDLEDYKIDDSITLWKNLEAFNIPNTMLLDYFNKPWYGLPDIHPLEIAKQLTALESTLYLRIQPFELVNYKNSQLSPNIAAILKFTNQLSNYVTETICSPQFSIAQKVYRLQNWLRIALSCAYFRNFNSVAAIMTSLQNHSIARLHPIWNALDRKDSTLFDYLARIIHPNHNFKVYRTKLNSIIKDHQYTKSPLPVVPFFNLYLQDLTFLDDGNPKFRNPDSFRPNKLINTDKYIRMTKIITDVQFFQVGYNKSSVDRLNNRESFSQLTEQLSIDTDVISDIPFLQEFIAYEFWRVNKYYEDDPDRGYNQSLKILPRSAN